MQLLAVARDLTERKEYENRLLATARELERSNAELEEFAYISSHDLQEPLRTLMLYAQMLTRRHADALGAEGQEVLGHLSVSSKRMSNMVRGLLAYAEARAQTPGSPTDLNAATHAALHNLKDTIRASGAHVPSR
jgi:light-regulated signal transduction histidine kinase (bacteriophytochrome)